MGIINDTASVTKERNEIIDKIKELREQNTFEIYQNQKELFALMKEASDLNENCYEWNFGKVRIQLHLYNIYYFKNYSDFKEIRLNFFYDEYDLCKYHFDTDVEIIVRKEEQFIFEEQNDGKIATGIKYYYLKLYNRTMEVHLHKYKEAFFWFLKNWQGLIEKIKEEERLKYVTDLADGSYYCYMEKTNKLKAFTEMMINYYKNPSNLKPILPENVEVIDLATLTHKEIKQLATRYEYVHLYEKKEDELAETITSFCSDFDFKFDILKQFISNITNDVNYRHSWTKATLKYQEGTNVFLYKMEMSIPNKEMFIRFIEEENDKEDDKEIINGKFTFNQEGMKYFIPSLYDFDEIIKQNKFIPFVNALKYFGNHFEKIMQDFFDEAMKEYEQTLTDYKERLEKEKQVLKNMELETEIKRDYYEKIFSSGIGDSEYFLF